LHEEARKKIKDIIGGIKFSGHFNTVFDNLKENRQNELIDWIVGCKKGQYDAISSEKSNQLIGFILKFRDTNFRAVLTKKKNEYFIALFLDKHKYYESYTRKLGF